MPWSCKSEFYVMCLRPHFFKALILLFCFIFLGEKAYCAEPASAEGLLASTEEMIQNLISQMERRAIANKYTDTTSEKESYEAAKTLIGKQIWINNRDVVRPQVLCTHDPNVFFPTRHLEQLQVTGIHVGYIGHSYGAGPFFLKVKNAEGNEGLIKYYDRYFFISQPIRKGTPAAIINKIMKGKVSIGMTKQQVLLSWGRPEKINKSVGAWGVHEQLVYGDQYLYLENGRLSSFQTSE